MRIYSPTEEPIFTYPTRNSLSPLHYLGVEVFGCDTNLPKISLPIFGVKVAAGFPSPADDYIEKSLDLNELLIQKPAATFFLRAQGESMLGAGIHPNDILVVDKSADAIDGKVVIATLNGEFTVKRLLKNTDGTWCLKAENPAFPDILLHEDLELVIWGVVTTVIHNL